MVSGFRQTFLFNTLSAPLLLGPVGGIAVGLLTSAATGKAIDNAEQKAKMKAQQKLLEAEEAANRQNESDLPTTVQ